VGEITKSKVPVSLFKKQEEIRTTTGFSFAAADVYFSGAGFPGVVLTHLKSSSLKSMEEFTDRCEVGTVITFDNIYVKDTEGKLREIDGMSIALTYNDVEEDNRVFNKVEVESSFPGGDKAWRDFLIKNLKAATPVDEGWGAGKYTVIVQFIVHTDGTVSDVTLKKYLNGYLPCKTANW
jgi:hypothetical protein